jgi:hypothetical protein
MARVSQMDVLAQLFRYELPDGCAWTYVSWPRVPYPWPTDTGWNEETMIDRLLHYQ